MFPAITEFFSNRAFGKQFQDVFEQIAVTITREYVQDAYEHMEKNGYPPTFEEIMQKVRSLTTELTIRAEWIRDNYREDRGYKSIKLTTGCKRMIKNSVNEYLRQTKTMRSVCAGRPQFATTQHLAGSLQNN